VLNADRQETNVSNIVDQYRITKEPYYRPVADEVELFEAAYSVRMPMMLKGPTGCGKTRFVEYMAHKLGKPLITVACNEDMTASDLVGRFLLSASGTEWQDGPLAIAARHGAICYLDEVVEARKDTTVVIHPLTDHRRRLVIDKTGEYVSAHPDFMMVISYNPGYQSVLKDLKQSTRQRFVSLEFDYPEKEKEAQIVAHEGRVSTESALKLVALAARIRSMREQGLAEGASTRLLIHAARLIGNGIPEREALRTAVCLPLTDDERLIETLYDLIEDVF
jgi:nitric oxide reductase NorQ protein